MTKFEKIVLIIISLVGIFLFINYFGNVFVWLLLSVFLCILGLPIVNVIEKFHIKKFRIPKSIATILALSLIIFIISIAIRYFLPFLINEISKFQAIDIETFSERLEKPMKSVEDFIINLGLFSQNDFSLEDYTVKKLYNLITFSNVSTIINNLGSTTIQFIIGTFSVLFISFFFLKDKKNLTTSLLSKVSENYQSQIITTTKTIKSLIIRYFYGLLAESAFLIIFCTLGLWAIGINFSLALLISLLIGILNVIPYVGPIIAIAIGCILISFGQLDLDFFSELWILELKYFIVVIIAQLIDKFVLQTIIFSKSVKAHPVEIYLVIIIAGSLYGILGMMFAIPVYTVLRVIGTVIFNDFNKKNLPENIIDDECI